ncbi:MAG TPA: hypothetical protein VEU55_04295 [Gemmatimonadales bacterium]|nr:hypothetical protein [Gemmatimonadales bacterium]
MAEIRPMGLGEILDGALTIYRHHLTTLLALGVVVLWLPVALTIYVQLAGPQEHAGLFLLASVIQYFAGLLLTAGAIRVISDSYLGRQPGIGAALALGLQKVWPLFVVGLAKGILLICIAVGIGIVAAVAIPTLAKAGGGGAVVTVALFAGAVWFAVFVACGYAVTTQVVVLEPLDSSFDAFRRSWELTRGRKLKVLGLAVVAFVLAVLPTAAIGAVAAFLRLSSPTAWGVLLVLGAILPVILTPILPCVLTVMYYDLRVRREAFDLELLGQQLGVV